MIVFDRVPVYFFWKFFGKKSTVADFAQSSRLAQLKTNFAYELFRRKSVTALQAEALTDHSLNRALGPV